MNKELAHEKVLAVPLPVVNPWQLITKFAVISMELSWVLPWFLLMTRSAASFSRLQFYLVFGGILVGSGMLYYAAQILRFHDRARMGVLILSFLASLAFGFITLVEGNAPLTSSSSVARWEGPFDWITNQLPLLGLTLLLSGVAWRRGVTLAVQTIGPLGAMRPFRIGVLMFITYGLVAKQLGAEAPDVELLIFLFSGLIALGGGRFSFLGHVRGGSKAPFPRRLVLAVVIITASMAAMMLLVGIFSRGTFAERLRQLVQFLFSVVAQLLLLLIKPLVFFAVRIFEWLFNLVQPILNQSRQYPLEPIQTEALQDLFTELDSQIERPLWVSELTVWMQRILIWGGVVLVVAVLFYGLRRWVVRPMVQSEDEGQSLIAPDDLVHMLLSMLRRRGREAVRTLRSLRPGERILAAARIRRIYAELLDLCAQLGHSRPASRTPTEFLPYLTLLFPSLEHEVTQITHAYVRVRYGELPEYKEQIDAIDAAWSRVKDEGLRQKRERKHSTGQAK